MRTESAIDGRGKRDTSRIAYAQLGPKLGRQQALIVDALTGDMTRAEIAERTGVRLSSVCGRVAELLAYDVIEELPRRRCRVTGESAHSLRLAAKQGRLFS